MMRPERAGAAVTGLAWAALTAGALAFFASPHAWILDASLGEAYAAAWIMAFASFEICVAAMLARGRSRTAKLSIAATAAVCIGVAILIAMWGAKEAALRVPPMIC